MNKIAKPRTLLAAVVGALAALVLIWSAPPATAAQDEPRINELQAKGTHNSYRLRPKNLLAWIIPALSYAHSPITDQLEYEGVRQLEIDVNWHGGQYRWLTFHIWFVDDETTCGVFTECLEEIRAWSQANPGHHPLTIMVEAKDELDFFRVQNRHFGDLDDDIRSVFAEDELIMPDSVRGGFDSLPEALASNGWPTIDASRGKVLFALLAESHERASYTAGSPALEGRAMFVSSVDATQPHAAYFKVDDPIRDSDRIHELVDAGFLVRTRADDSAAHKSTYPARRDAAYASGAQYVSTDFPLPGRIRGLDYDTAVPGGTPSRCNPRNAPAGCVAADIEDLTPSSHTLEVEVGVGGDHAYSNSGTVGDDELFVGPRGLEPLGNLSGGGVLDDAAHGSPAVDFDLFPIIPGFGLLNGTVRIVDASEGIDIGLAVVVASSRRTGSNGVDVQATVVEAGLPPELTPVTLHISEI